MIEELQQRLLELKTEFESGQKMLIELETKQGGLRDSMLRISGAIQVLEELLKDKLEQNNLDASKDTHALEEQSIGV